MSVMAVAMGADLQQMLFVAVMNPGAILAGFFVGRYANEMQKIIVGGFAAGFAGLAFVWLVNRLGFYVGDMQSVGGVFVLSFIVGLVWFFVGFKTQKKA